ncbi:MAG: RNA polymerase sigma factor [Clostridiales bacterium]|nr:RNA polymerase sigma factor [Clostridiales bacterium]
MTIDQIIQDFHQDALNFSIHLSGDFHKGSDLVQDALLKVVERQHLFDEMHPTQVKAWLFKTIKNKHIDTIRKDQRKRLLVMSQLTVEDFQDERVLKMLVTDLNEEERKVISLKYYSGYNSKEIAEMINMNPSTVRNRLSTAVSKLREAYRED